MLAHHLMLWQAHVLRDRPTFQQLSVLQSSVNGVYVRAKVRLRVGIEGL